MALDLVIVGRLGSPYGLSGWLHLTSFTEPPDNILKYEPWIIVDNENSIERDVVKQYADAYIVKFSGVDDRNRASNLRGRELAIDSSLLPPTAQNEFYWHKLIGLKVKDTHGRVLGSVGEIFDNGAHSVLVVRGQGREEILIPMVESAVVEVKDYVLVDWELG